MADYSIWVLEYAAVEKFPFNVMMYGPQHQGIRKLPYAYALLKGKGETILIDTGYDHVNYGRMLAESYGVSNYHGPREVLHASRDTPASAPRRVPMVGASTSQARTPLLVCPISRPNFLIVP